MQRTLDTARMTSLKDKLYSPVEEPKKVKKPVKAKKDVKSKKKK